MGIRDYVINNFKNDEVDTIYCAIDESIIDNSEETLPGMGVLLEILWRNSSNDEKNKISKTIFDGIKKGTIHQ